MTPERWQRTEDLYHAAHALPSGERAAFLAEACVEDEALRRDVESLLNEPGSDDGFLTEPAFVMPAHMVSELTPMAMTGRSLGGYHFQALLGAGGMGEVYRAHDSKLGRDVAIKILPRAFTSDPDRLARFEREARMLAALNHPNICAIYGLEEADSVRFLVLELVEGYTLAESLATSLTQARASGLPLGEALTIARQIAEALEIAHEKGIVHRDLKPANIKITPDGVVKVLDFGLAKAVSGEGSSAALTHAPPTTQGEARHGAVIGTAAYMSPEQARGLPVDKRTDIWAFGCVLYEMLTGRITFAGETVSDSIAKILEREPDWSALPTATPAPIRRLLLRCLTKDPKKRLRDIGDLRIEIDALDDAVEAIREPPPATRAIWLPWLALATVIAAVGLWILRPLPIENPLPSDGFKLLTDWPGSEGHGEISPDGKVVAFLGDRDGEIDLFSGQVGEVFKNLTEGIESLDPVAIQRRIGFSDDSTRLWFGARGPKMDMPWSGGAPRPFLVAGAQTPAWSSDGRLVYFNQLKNDSLLVADGAGRNAQEIGVDWSAADTAPHNHNMVWSSDNEWIYFVHGDVRDWNHQADDMDIWRIRPSGGSPERLTYLNTSVTFLAMLDQETLVFIAPDEDGYGSWLWSLDVGRLRTSRTWWGVDRLIPRRIPTGLEQYTSVSASRDRGPVVATRTNPTSSLWSVPIHGDRQAGEDDATLLRLPTERALAPRFARRAVSPLLFYLSARGTGDRVWRFSTTPFEITKGAEGHLSETPAPSPDGSRVAVIVKEAGQRHIAVMNQDGQGSQTLAASIDIQGAADWSPDGGSIAAGGRDATGRGLFIIPVDGGPPRRVVSEPVTDPVWSSRGDFIVYAGPFSGGSAIAGVVGSPLRAVRPDGTKYDLPLVGQAVAREDLRVCPGGYRFLDETHLVYRPIPESPDFWLFDLVKGDQKQITRLGNKGGVRGFDITPDGTHIVFDRTRQNGDIVLIDRPRN
jgi:serine/threonine protein kinase/Tol biopolymer transport system component